MRRLALSSPAERISQSGQGAFGGYRLAVRAAGLTPRQWGLRVETAALLEDWGKAVRQVGGVPSRREYERVGTYWYDCLANRFQTWSQVPAAFSQFAASGGLSGDWTDVLEKIRRGPIPKRGGCPDLPKKRLAAQREAARLAYEASASQSAQINDALASHPTEPPQPVATIASIASRQTEANTANPQLLPPPSARHEMRHRHHARCLHRRACAYRIAMDHRCVFPAASFEGPSSF